jgi:hypothetical protein
VGRSGLSRDSVFENVDHWALVRRQEVACRAKRIVGYVPSPCLPSKVCLRTPRRAGWERPGLQADAVVQAELARNIRVDPLSRPTSSHLQQHHRHLAYSSGQGSKSVAQAHKSMSMIMLDHCSLANQDRLTAAEGLDIAIFFYHHAEAAKAAIFRSDADSFFVTGAA